MSNFADALPGIEAEYLATADYFVDGDCGKARRFATALAKMIALPSTAAKESESYTFQIQVWKSLLADVQTWIATNCTPVTAPASSSLSGAGGGAVYYDVSKAER